MTIEKRYSLKDLKQLTGTSHAYIYKQIQKGNLAKPEKWGRASRWKESDVNAWLETLDRGLHDNSHLVDSRLTDTQVNINA